MTERPIRERVFAELTTVLAAGSLLDSHRPEVLVHLDDELMARVLDRFRQTRPKGRFDGRVALVTAGPVGAGKSRAIHMAAEFGTYGRIDADDAKALIIAELHAIGAFGFLEDFALSDGRPVAPMELAGWFHRASTVIADIETEWAMNQRENVIIEGTLTWSALVDRYVADFADAGYTALTVVDVEVPASLAIEGVKARWWRGRTDGADHRLGGRFVPEATVAKAFEDGVSVAAVNALAVYRRAIQEGMEARLRRIVRLTVDGPQMIRDTRTDSVGWVDGDPARIFDKAEDDP